MIVKESLKANGSVKLIKNGKVEFEDHNLVVTIGKNWVAQMMASGSVVMSHMAVGEGTNLPVDGDQALSAELGDGRVEMTPIGGSVSGNTVQYTATWQAGIAIGALTEAGMFNNDVGGDMLARVTFGVVNKNVDDVVAIVWTISIV